LEPKRSQGKEKEQEIEVIVSAPGTNQPGLDHREQEVPASVHPPFPERLVKSKKEKEDKEIFDVFNKVEINIPLLNAIKKVPRYAKFLKELCANKRKIAGYECISVGENASAVLQKKLPPKCKDKGMFSISCTVGNLGIK